MDSVGRGRVQTHFRRMSSRKRPRRRASTTLTTRSSPPHTSDPQISIFCIVLGRCSFPNTCRASQTFILEQHMSSVVSLHLDVFIELAFFGSHYMWTRWVPLPGWGKVVRVGHLWLDKWTALSREWSTQGGPIGRKRWSSSIPRTLSKRPTHSR